MAQSCAVYSSVKGESYLEILVTFEDAAERDFYFSKARNLSQFHDDKGQATAGLRMDIPPFLLPTFKLLNDHGFHIKNTHGSETRRYVKYDDANMSLYLEVKIPEGRNWIKIRPDEARLFCEERDRLDYQTIRRGLLRGQTNTTASIPATSGAGLNPNLVPLGNRIHQGSTRSSSSNRDGPMPSTSKGKWVPPPRSTPRSN